MNDEQEILNLFESADDAFLRGKEASSYAVHMLKWMDPKPNASIIELACGNGRVAQCIKTIRPDLDYSCMDICPTLTKQAKALNPDMKVHTGNCLRQIPLGHYDQIVSWGFIQYISPGEFINLNRMLLTKLKKDGEIWHFSIPDNTKRWEHTMSVRKGIFSKIKGLIKYILESPKRHYAAASIWHDPEELKIGQDESVKIQTIRPGDMPYRFHIVMKKRV